MSSQKYLIDTNVFIGLEDDQKVGEEVASLVALANKHNVNVFIHEAAKDDIARDSNFDRRAISLSKIAKFQTLKKVRGLKEEDLEKNFGPLPRPNDVVDAKLLHALATDAADFLVTEDRKLHARARQYAPHLSRRVLFIADATALLISTYEPVKVPFRYVEEVGANEIPLTDDFFNTLREGYNGFDDWWRKCVKQHRRCWAVFDGDTLAGLIVRKDETTGQSDATLPGNKILKICTFKVRPENRGTKLGELLLKQALWFAQSNGYDVVYLTTKAAQQALVDLLEYYGFQLTTILGDNELVYEKKISHGKLEVLDDEDLYEADRRNYPRFYTGSRVQSYIVPIRESYHDILFPELKNDTQGDLLSIAGLGTEPKCPGNTIRKVYLCRAQANLYVPGSLLFFYKGSSDWPPSQAVTTVGVFEDMQLAKSTSELMRLVGGRSVYSEKALIDWKAAPENPVKVINFLLAGYINPPLTLEILKAVGVIAKYPPQSIKRLSREQLNKVLPMIKFGFNT